MSDFCSRSSKSASFNGLSRADPDDGIVRITPGGVPGAAALQQFAGLTGTSFTWPTNISAGVYFVEFMSMPCLTSRGRD